MNNNLKKKILYIDDDVTMQEMVEEILDMYEYNSVIEDDNCNIKELLEKENIYIVITDINMPKVTGIDILKEVHEIDPNLPVILLTGSTETDDMMQAIKLGAYDYLKKPFNITDLLFTVKQAINDRTLKLQNIEYKQHLEEMVQERTKQLRVANKRIEENTIRAIMGMVNALEARDPYTKGHSERVTNISIEIARLFGYSKRKIDLLRLGALMHDIGKIGVKQSILHKPSRLTDEEYNIMKGHPEIGAHIIEPIQTDDEVLAVIIQHHEHFDGSGYPHNLKSDEITLNSRIVAVADTFDAITTSRPYRDALSYDYALNEINKFSGIQFDPEVVNKFNLCIDKINDEFLNKPQYSLFSNIANNSKY